MNLKKSLKESTIEKDADKISSMLSRDNHFMKMVDNTDRICKLSIYDVEKPSVYRVDQI